jgi:hypothetical protein
MGIINIYAPWLDSATKMCDIDGNINVEIFVDQMPTMSGIIYCESTRDIINKCNLLTPDVYHSMRDAIEDNYNRSMEYSSFNKSIIDQPKKIIKQI